MFKIKCFRLQTLVDQYRLESDQNGSEKKLPTHKILVLIYLKPTFVNVIIAFSSPLLTNMSRGRTKKKLKSRTTDSRNHVKDTFQVPICNFFSSGPRAEPQ